MTVYQRFDLAESASLELSDGDVKHRWESFHANIRAHSDSTVKRIGGRMLGEGTLRYQIPRTLGRPLVRLARRRQSDPRRTGAPVDVQSAPDSSPFPTDYRPEPVRHRTDVDVRDVIVVVVNDAATSHLAVVDSLNRTVEGSRATWLQIIDATTTADDRNVATTTLRANTDESVDVVFADEVGRDLRAPIFKPSKVGPHTLLSYNVVGRPALIRISALRDIGGFDTNVGWAFEHDAYLRLLEARATFHHVAAVLPAGSAIMAPAAPPAARR